jgi:hypothetical protein
MTTTTDEQTLTIRRTADGEGCEIVLFKPAGLNKGTTVLATFCGGPLGRRLAGAAAESARRTLMIDCIDIDL